MRIKSLEIDGYGVWSKLKLDKLGEGIHVFYGANEAGKTTLMQFLRSMFFGFSPERRRYFPPVHGGRHGGAVDLVTPDGSFHLSRHDDERSVGPRASGVLSAPDGTRHGESYIQSLLAGIDEATFNNVFSVGLRELQELGVLNDTEAASLLFRLTAGLDRVSLVEVIAELEASRRRLLADNGREGQIPELVARRDELRRRLEELDSLTAQYGQLTSQRAALDRDAERLDGDRAQLEHQARVLETAVSLRDRWNRRGQIDAQLAALDLATTGLQDSLDRFVHWNRRLSRLRKRIGRVEARRRKTRRRAAAIKINEPLVRQAARIEAFCEQEGWITSLQANVSRLDAEARQLAEQAARQRDAAGLDAAHLDSVPAHLGRKATAGLRRVGQLVRRRRDAMAEARSRLEERTAAAREQAAQLQTALAGRGVNGLEQAIRAAGELAAQLRRCVQLEGRIEQMQRNQAELEDRSRELLDRQSLPLPVVMGLGGVCACSVIMILVGLLSPTSAIGALRWPLAILGVGGVLVTLAVKVILERSNTRKLGACGQRIEMLELQIGEASKEHAELERSLPPAASRAAQLEAAEKDLAELEQLLPLGARRQAADHEVELARLHVEQAERELRAARRQWADTLAHAGLSPGLSPKQIRRLLSHRRQWAATAHRSEQVAAELRSRQAELDAVRDRVVDLATQAGVAAGSGNPIELLRRLSESLREETAHAAQRNELLLAARRLRRRRAKLDARLRPLRRRRRECLRRLGVRSVDELRRKRQSLNQASQLQRQRQALQAEIETALAGQCSEAELAACLAGQTDQDLEARWDAIGRQLDAIRTQLDACIEQRGQVKAQLAELADDRRPAKKRLELSTLDKRLAAAVRRWRVLSLTGRILANVKDYYETQRQPETLQEASKYLRRLTGGRYVRVWTPLGEDVLRVDDSRGNVLAVEVLSQGAREQLFLALRLALVACYARRGVHLPLILDDVLVNFDTPRAKAAAALLRDFAAGGHQLLVFTCHDHILSLFKSLDVDVRRLPSHVETAAGVAAATVSAEPARSKRRRKRRLRKQRKRDRQFSVEDEMSAWIEDDADPPDPAEIDMGIDEIPWDDDGDRSEEEEAGLPPQSSEEEDEQGDEVDEAA